MSKVVDWDIYLRVKEVNEFDTDRVYNFLLAKIF